MRTSSSRGGNHLEHRPYLVLPPAPTEEEYLEAVGEENEGDGVDGEGEGWTGSDGRLFWKENVYEYGEEVKTNVLECLLERFFMEMCALFELADCVAQRK